MPTGKIKAKCNPISPDTNIDCCLARILSLHKDFQDQKPRIQQTIEDAGHLCIFLPKFHCELNPIEMVGLVSRSLCYSLTALQYWGWVKIRYRAADKPSFAAAKQIADELFNSCPAITIKKFITRV